MVSTWVNISAGKKNPIYCNGRNFHIDERSQNIYPFKKRKFFNQSPISASDGGLHHEGIINFPNKRINGDNHSAGSQHMDACFPFLLYFLFVFKV